MNHLRSGRTTRTSSLSSKPSSSTVVGSVLSYCYLIRAELSTFPPTLDSAHLRYAMVSNFRCSNTKIHPTQQPALYLTTLWNKDCLFSFPHGLPRDSSPPPRYIDEGLAYTMSWILDSCRMGHSTQYLMDWKGRLRFRPVPGHSSQICLLSRTTVAPRLCV